MARMNRTLVLLLAALTSGLAATDLACAQPARASGPAVASKPAVTPPPEIDRILRGRYIVETGGCGDCHTPLKMGSSGPEPDMKRMLSGHPESLVMPPVPKLPTGPWLVVSSVTNTAWAGPWGVSFTANLTPDVDTGIGRWSAKQFADTMRLGKHLGNGRTILPPMPIPAYKNFNDADLEAIYAYLMSIPPVKNRVPQPVPSATPASAAAIKK